MGEAHGMCSLRIRIMARTGRDLKWLSAKLRVSVGEVIRRMVHTKVCAANDFVNAYGYEDNFLSSVYGGKVLKKLIPSNSRELKKSEDPMRDVYESNLHIKVTAEMHKALSDHAKERGRSVSEIIRGLIAEEVRASKAKDASIARELIARIDHYGKKLKALGVEKGK